VKLFSVLRDTDDRNYNHSYTVYSAKMLHGQNLAYNNLHSVTDYFASPVAPRLKLCRWRCIANKLDYIWNIIIIDIIIIP